MDELYNQIRDFEKRLQEHMHEIYCPVHLALGHENIAVEIAKTIKGDDWLFATHRNHHLYFAKGGQPQALWDEIMGLPSGINKGFAGSQAIVDPSINFHSSAILGGLIGVAVGTAKALQIDKSDSIVICSIGDAGTEQGVFWESLNFAALQQLPILFLVENNGKSVDALIEERQATPICPRVEAFGVKVFKTITDAIDFTRTQRLPSFHEAKVTLECAHLNMATMLDLCQ